MWDGNAATPTATTSPTADVTSTPSHSFLRSLNLASAPIWAATTHQSEMADGKKPLHHAHCQLAFHVTLAPICGSNLVSHGNPEVSYDRIYPLIFRSFSFSLSRIFFSFLPNSDSISKAQLKILSFPITYTNRSRKHEFLLYSNHHNTFCPNYSLRHQQIYSLFIII